jgi:PAS domain S-box-containing protein
MAEHVPPGGHDHAAEVRARTWGTEEGATSQRQTEQARAYLAAIVESSDDAIIAKDLNGIIRSCNATAERLFGYTAAELIGQPVRLLIPKDRESEEDVILDRIHRGERVDHFETLRRAKDGRLIDISLTVSPVRDDSGTIIGVSKIARDISAQRQADAAIAELRRRGELDRQSAAADRERLLAAERTARADAERASRSKDEFVAMVSHELRTPLNAILGWTQLMSSAREDPHIIERGLDVIARNTRVQAQLIADLLDISRIASGKLRLDTQVIGLHAVLQDAIETVERDAASRSIRISQFLDNDVGPVEGDPARLQQAVWNLLSNAIKFTPEGGHVAISLSADDGVAIIAVRDTGAGISPDVLPRVFERFHQADRSITRRFGGLGLGLAIVKHLVELHGGTAQAESDGEGRGSTFTIRLPTSAAAIRGPAEVTRSPPIAPVDLHALDVLLVEDEPDTREYLQRLLQEHGAVVRAASSAPEALSLFRQERPDLLVSDIGLPDMDGCDLMAQIRREDSGTLPAIALTAYARNEDRDRALGAGFHVHLAKPTEPSELLAAVRSLAHLRPKRRRAQTEAPVTREDD